MPSPQLLEVRRRHRVDKNDYLILGYGLFGPRLWPSSGVELHLRLWFQVLKAVSHLHLQDNRLHQQEFRPCRAVPDLLGKW